MYKNSQNNALIRQNINFIENERREIAFELHNEIGQNLTAIRTAAQLIHRQSEGRQTHPVAETIVDLTDQMFAIMSQMLHRLHPSVLDKFGFEEAIEDLNVFVKKNMQLTCSLVVDGDVDALDKDMQLALYRIIQESLTNAVRHGQAKRAKISIKIENNNLQLTVSNDGEALVNDLTGLVQQKSSGIGLLGIQHRVHAWQGDMTFENKDNAVVLHCILPLAA